MVLREFGGNKLAFIIGTLENTENDSLANV